MKELIISLGITSLGCVIYQLGQKSISPTANPVVVLATVYLLAFLSTMLAIPFFKVVNQTISFATLFHWPILTVALGSILIEGGFLFIYRTGGSLQWSSVIVGAIAALVLIPIDIFLFNKEFSVIRSVGIIVVLLGMVLVAYK